MMQKTKEIFFQEWVSKQFFDLHVSCRLGRVTESQHIFKSGLIIFFLYTTNANKENDNSNFSYQWFIFCIY